MGVASRISHVSFVLVRSALLNQGCEVEVSRSLHSRNRLEGASPHPLGKRTTGLTTARSLAYHVPTTFAPSISHRLAVLTLLSADIFHFCETITSLFLHVSRTCLFPEVSAIKNLPTRENSTIKTKRALEAHPQNKRVVTAYLRLSSNRFIWLVFHSVS